MDVINPRLTDLEEKSKNLRERIIALEAKHEELSRKVTRFASQIIWQSISFAVIMIVTVLGAMSYQTSILDKRIDQIEKRLERPH